ncbi:MAG: hypothetical protein ABFD44_11185 [Anaerolineaceae bacterium]
MKQTFQMIQADPNLIKPTLFTLLAGLGIGVIGFLFISPVVVWWGNTPAGQALVGLLCVLALIAMLIAGSIFSALTVDMFYGYLLEGGGRMDHAWEIVRRRWLDLLGLAGASALVTLFKPIIRGNKRSAVYTLLGEGISAIWTEATFLILPAMVIEDLKLKDGVKRAAEMIHKNLLLVSVNAVAVRLINTITGLVFGAGGVILGFYVGNQLVTTSQGNAWHMVSGVAAGMLIATVLVMLAVMLNNYTSSIYHTCLFMWARGEEIALTEGSVTHAVAPTPLATVLS